MKFLIWSNEHKSWWCADRNGYTQKIENAGRYPLGEALEICKEALICYDEKFGPDETLMPEDALSLEGIMRKG